MSENALAALKFSESDFQGQDIASLDDRPKLTAAELKARFDNIGKVMLALSGFNQLLDLLISGEALAAMGATASGAADGTLAAELEAINGRLTSLEAGGISIYVGTEEPVMARYLWFDTSGGETLSAMGAADNNI